MRMAALLVLAFVPVADGGTTDLPALVENALTPIDTVPTKNQIDDAFLQAGSNDPLGGLRTIASNSGEDTGVRLRAIHALSKYCPSPCSDSDPAHQTLTALVSMYAMNESGQEVVMLRGAIESLGPQRVDTDLPLLVAQLDHPSRDVRAAAAHALRDLCNTQAVNPLRFRLQHEPTDQVRQAITDALRVLNQPMPCQ
jgi:HEAT repeat protein